VGQRLALEPDRAPAALDDGAAEAEHGTALPGAGAGADDARDVVRPASTILRLAVTVARPALTGARAVTGTPVTVAPAAVGTARAVTPAAVGVSAPLVIDAPVDGATALVARAVAPVAAAEGIAEATVFVHTGVVRRAARSEEREAEQPRAQRDAARTADGPEQRGGCGRRHAAASSIYL
jgi:hypothetical protein